MVDEDVVGSGGDVAVNFHPSLGHGHGRDDYGPDDEC